MKVFIAYTLVAMGIPFIVGYIFGIICSKLISLIFPIASIALKDSVTNACRYLFNGLGAILTAGFLFHLFKLHPGLAVLGIVALWEFGVSFAQSTRAKVQNRLDLSGWGVIIGWIIVLWLFPAT
jgi:hypothetical protein